MAWECMGMAWHGAAHGMAGASWHGKAQHMAWHGMAQGKTWLAGSAGHGIALRIVKCDTAQERGWCGTAGTAWHGMASQRHITPTEVCSSAACHAAHCKLQPFPASIPKARRWARRLHQVKQCTARRQLTCVSSGWCAPQTQTCVPAWRGCPAAQWGQAHKEHACRTARLQARLHDWLPDAHHCWAVPLA